MATNITLPASLTDVKPLRAEFEYITGLSKTESRFESGATYAKQTAIKGNDRFNCKLFMSESQREDFLTWYRDTLKNGTLTFLWTHPLSGGQIEVLFVGAPNITSAGVSVYYVSGTYEIVS